MSLLCEYCKKIDFAKVESQDGYRHHRTMAELLDCAQSKLCDLCALIAAEKEASTEINKYTDKVVASFFPDPRGSTSNNNSEPIEKSSGQVIISINDIGDNSGTKRLCIFEEDILEGGRLRDHGALQNAKIDGQAVLIQIYTDGESLVAKKNLIPGRRLSYCGNSTSCLDLSKQWLKDCLDCKKHPACGKGNPKTLPARVIKVGATDKEVCLHVTKHGEIGRWYTLSWCWGVGVAPPKLEKLDPTITDPEKKKQNEKSTIIERAQGISLDTLPLVFQDAIRLTRMLGCPYLWIDSLCILQNCADDWAEQAAVMGDVYRNSELCISADAAQDCERGIFKSNHELRDGVLDSYKVKFPYFNSNNPKIEGSIYPLRMASKDALQDSGPLGTRAWTFQESALSPRELIWTKLELKWHCRTARFSERYPAYEMDTLKSKPNFKRDLAQTQMSAMDTGELWRRVVQSYTARSITNSTDIFPALGGIAREIQNLSKGGLGEYYAGLWEKDMHKGLLWSLMALKKDDHAKDRENYTAPSWSWASTVPRDGRNWLKHVRYPNVNNWESFKEESNIIKAQVDYVNSKYKFGKISSGVLTIKAPHVPIKPETELGEVRLQKAISADDCNPLGNLICLKISSNKWTMAEVNFSLQQLKEMALKDENPTTLVTKSQNHDVWSLILERTEKKNEYKRIGLSIMEHSITEGWENIEVNII